jgi:tetratricopeptide (TPR) repeat protein
MKENQMKKYLIVSSVVISLIMLFFAINLSSKTPDEKVKSFNASVKHENEGNIDKAIESLTLIYASNKENYLLNIRLGWLYYQKKDFSKSKEFYSSAISLRPNSIEAKLGLTLPSSADNEWDTVKELYLDILKIDAMNYSANLRLGQIYLQNSDYNNAKKYLEIAYNSFPSYYEPNLSLGWNYYYLGYKDKAKALLTQALMLNEGDSLATAGLNLIR